MHLDCRSRRRPGTLPARAEGMIAQAASGIAGIEVTTDGSLVFEEHQIDPEAPLLDPFFASDSYVGLRAFLTSVADNTGPIKVSLTGPVTLGVALHAAGLDADLAFRVAGRTTRTRLGAARFRRATRAAIAPGRVRRRAIVGHVDRAHVPDRSARSRRPRVEHAR